MLRIEAAAAGVEFPGDFTKCGIIVRHEFTDHVFVQDSLLGTKTGGHQPLKKASENTTSSPTKNRDPT